ncbi:MAG: bifunctional pyr operon transcriptional regulator/uracil phosphoribosyltransferase PyrR [Bacteroidota bacterium]
MENPKLELFPKGKLEVTLLRLCHEIIERHKRLDGLALLGVQPRGVYLSRRIHNLLNSLVPENSISYGELDVTFFRDDFRTRTSPLEPNKTHIDFLIESKEIILVDDVLYTGRTVRAAMDAMLAYGRPKSVELLVLVDRKRTRHLPVEANYVGIEVDTITSERVIVQLQEAGGTEDSVFIFDQQTE